MKKKIVGEGLILATERKLAKRLSEWSKRV
jgi:hypothetical protein